MHKTIKPWHLLGVLEVNKPLMRRCLERMRGLGDVGVVNIGDYEDLMDESGVEVVEICGTLLSINYQGAQSLITRRYSMANAMREFGGTRVMEMFHEGFVRKEGEFAYERAN